MLLTRELQVRVLHGSPFNSEGFMDVWYLLFDGSSPDGSGWPDYIGRTTDKEVAKEHFWKTHYSNNPYSTGKVDIVDDSSCRRAEKKDFN